MVWQFPAVMQAKFLFVDLTEGILTEETLDESVYREFIGGNGLGVRVLYEKMKAGVDALGPENILGFVTGCLTGTLAPGSGRHMLVYEISPHRHLGRVQFRRNVWS